MAGRVYEHPTQAKTGPFDRLRAGFEWATCPPGFPVRARIGKPHPFDFAQGRLSRKRREKWGTPRLIRSVILEWHRKWGTRTRAILVAWRGRFVLIPA
jgi:hypothetical protein